MIQLFSGSNNCSCPHNPPLCRERRGDEMKTRDAKFNCQNHREDNYCALNSTPAFTKCKLGKGHGEELVATTEIFAVDVTPILLDAGSKCVTRQDIHQLRKQHTPFVHGALQLGKAPIISGTISIHGVLFFDATF